jgi:hypothetical protein
MNSRSFGGPTPVTITGPPPTKFDANQCRAPDLERQWFSVWRCDGQWRRSLRTNAFCAVTGPKRIGGPCVTPIEILPLEDDGVCDACFAMTILHHPHGSDEWIVSVDDDKEIKLRTSELTSYRRFREATIQAWRLYPLMTDEEWNVILAEALHDAQIRAAFLQCRYRR